MTNEITVVIVRLIAHLIDLTLLSFYQYVSFMTNGINVVVVVIQVGV